MQSKKRYWFRAKLYGWGWYPATWEGWLCILIYFVIFIYLSKDFDSNSYSSREVIFRYVSPTVILTLILIAISYLKGEKPRWRWGK